MLSTERHLQIEPVVWLLQLMNILGAADTTPAARPGQTAAPSTAPAAPATTGRISAGGKSRKGR